MISKLIKEENKKPNNTLELFMSDDPKKFEKAVVLYSDDLYNGIKNSTKILSDEELKRYSYNFIRNFVSRKTNKPSQLLQVLNTNIKREIEAFKDEEKALKRYLFQEELTARILKYISNKYVYLLDIKTFNTSQEYNLVKNKFEDIIRESLCGTSRNEGIECTLTKKISYLKTMINPDRKKENIKNEGNIDFMKQKYSYIKYSFFEKNSGNMPDEELISLIDKKYDDFIEAYLNGSSTNTINHYLFQRFQNFFQHKLLTISLDKLEEITQENRNTILLYNKKVTGFLSPSNAEEEISNYYERVVYQYYVGCDKKSTLYKYVIHHLRNYVKLMNLKYKDDKIVQSIKDTCYDSRIIDSNIIEELFQGWVNHYLKSENCYNVTFEEFMISILRGYDENDYRNILDVKEHMNCKVLKRPVIK